MNNTLTPPRGVRVKGFMNGVTAAGEDTACEVATRHHDNGPTPEARAQEIFNTTGPDVALAIQ